MVYEDIDRYIDKLTRKLRFVDDLFTRDYSYTVDELNLMLKDRYSKFSISERLNFMADKISEVNFKGSLGKSKKILSELYERLNIKLKLIDIYVDFFKSEDSLLKRDISDIKNNRKLLNYDDACLYVYMKCKLYGYNYNTWVKEIVIDEAQDYSMGQIKLISKIFKNASFTILGDINQTINPYYKYDSLEDLCKILDDAKYIELTKTYRSTEEIINYSNKVLGLNHISAVRRNESMPVIIKEENDLNNQLREDIKSGTGKSLAIITKNQSECDKIYNLLKDTGISKIDNNSKKFNRDLIVVPVYMAKGLEFDSVIIYTDKNNRYTDREKYLYYVAITRAQHRLVVYNQK